MSWWESLTPTEQAMVDNDPLGERWDDPRWKEPMNYSGPGLYRHYKGGLYEVLGLGLKEDTVTKTDKETGEFTQIGEGHDEVICVVYKPVPYHEKESLLDSRDEDFWLRELDDFNATLMVDDHTNAPRFRREQCVQCGNNTRIQPAGSIVVCANCGNNWPT